MGAVVNSDPELWGAVVADVPFVDVLNTMLDDTLPLTPGEWPEWGNPITDKAAFDLIRSYSPYDNVKAQDYPPMLITGGLTDPRVTYWEPAKWAAKLRATKTDDNPLFLKINMGAGHGGKSGRWEKLHEVRGDLRVHPDRGAVTRPVFEMTLDRRRPSTSTSSATSTMRCGCSGSSRSRSRIGIRSPIRRTRTLISGSWCGTRSTICAPRIEGDRITARTWVGDAPQGARFDRYMEFIGADGKVCVRAKTAVGDYRQGVGTADPRAARSDSAVHWRSVSSSRHEPRPILYDYCRSSAAYRVRIALNLKGVDYESRQVDLREGEQKSAEYRALNPQGLVPMLEIDGHRLTQSLAIINYLDLRYPNQPLIPAIGRRARACRRDGDGDRLRHPSAEQSARAQISEERARPFAGRGRRLVRALDQRRPAGARSHGRAAAPAPSCSAMRRPAPTSAWCRSSTTRGGSTCRSTLIRLCCAPKRMPTSSRRSPPPIRTGRR